MEEIKYAKTAAKGCLISSGIFDLIGTVAAIITTGLIGYIAVALFGLIPNFSQNNSVTGGEVLKGFAGSLTGAIFLIIACVFLVITIIWLVSTILMFKYSRKNVRDIKHDVTGITVFAVLQMIGGVIGLIVAISLFINKDTVTAIAAPVLAVGVLLTLCSSLKIAAAAKIKSEKVPQAPPPSIPSGYYNW